MKISRIAAVLAGALALAAAGTVCATPTITHLQVYDGIEGDMIVGDGIPTDNFTQGSFVDGDNTGYVSLKARDRDTGEPSSQSGNYYYIDRGYASVDPLKPNLSFDFQFDPGTDNTTKFVLQLMVDFDPTTGTDFATLQGSIDVWSSSDGYFLNGHESYDKTNAWNSVSVPYVVSDSLNLGFGFWSSLNSNAASYDPNRSGDYEIQFSVLDADASRRLASATIHAVVVPEPGPLGLMGLGLLLLGGLAWRRTLRRVDARAAAC